MGAIGGLLGTAGGVNGTGISGPNEANIQQGVTLGQTGQAYQGAQQGLAQQQALLDALKGQNAIGNQQSVFNQGQTLARQLDGGVGVQSGAQQQQQALNQQLAANNGAGNLGQVYGQGQQLAGQLAGAGAVQNQSSALAAQQALAQQQQATAQQYQNIANGTGPNPAQAALNNATGQNVANQSAMMASQRGAGANVGLVGRQAAMQGANIQQQSVGQSALQQAQQQIAGLQGLSGQQQAIGNTQQNVAGIAGQQLAAQQAQQQALAGQAAQQVGLQQAGTTAQAQMGAQQIGQQQAAQQALAGQAANQVQQQAGATTALSQGHQAEQGQLLGGMNAQNSAATGMQGNINSANAGLAGTQMQGQQATMGGLMNAAGSALSMATGGEIKPQKFADGGPTSSFGQFLSGWSGSQGSSQSPDTSFVNLSAGPNNGANELKSALGGIKPKMPNIMGGKEGQPMAGPDAGGGGSPVDSIMSAAPLLALAAKGGLANKGGHVAAKKPSEKAVAKGNSYSNDKIPAMLSEGEIVIPRNVLQSGDPVAGAADFVSRIMAKRGKK